MQIVLQSLEPEHQHAHNLRIYTYARSYLKYMIIIDLSQNYLPTKCFDNQTYEDTSEFRLPYEGQGKGEMWSGASCNGL